MPYAFLDLPADVTNKISAFQELWALQYRKPISRSDAVTQLVRSHMLRQYPWGEVVDVGAETPLRTEEVFTQPGVMVAITRFRHRDAEISEQGL
jgi:hypothetical protein